MQRHQASLAEFGLTDQQAVARHVGNRQLQRFGYPQACGREQCYQGGIGQRAQAALGPKLQGNLDQAFDLRSRVDMWRSPPLAGAKVIGRRQLVPVVLDSDMPREAADGLQPSIALRDGRPERRPIDGRLRVNMRLPALGCKGGKALQQVLCILHREASGSAEVEISVDGVQHQSTPGQGCAICFRSATSAFA